ncbi:MAG TPA: D-TA family PLP-dependent enzyme [Parafilimonas sp.]|nr:D-TA family PLP-dependent enzyme [Parafilimonas sp.]
MNWYEIKNIETIDSPALVIYKERILENIRKIKSMKDVAHLRPHVKTNKIAEVCEMMLGEGITKFKCATIAEAEMLGMIDAPDVLLAYQPVGPKVTRLLQLVKQYPSTHFSCVIDEFENAKHISEIFDAENLVLDVYIDLNTGMNRTGVKPSEKAIELFNRCNKLRAINIIGLHVYDGHIRDTDVATRTQKADEAFQAIVELSAKIKSEAGKEVRIVAGGSPTFPIHAQRTNIECSPGTFVFWDWGYKSLTPDEPFDFAALVISRVISVVDANTICTDLGHKSISAENPLEKRVHFLNVPDAEPIGQSEEHLVLKVPDASKFRVGDVLYGVPIHICPTVALYEKAVVVENNEAIDEWRVIARDKKITV